MTRFRSKFEQNIAALLPTDAAYESTTIPYTIPSTYTPDWTTPSGWHIETKGRFTATDRRKHLLIRNQYPNIKILFIFQNANLRISKASTTTYGQWCDKHQIRWIDQKQIHLLPTIIS